MPSRDTFDAFASDEFLAGLGFGSAAFAIGVLVIYVWRQWRSDAVPIGGALMTAAAAAGVQGTFAPSTDLWVGIAMLVGAGALYPWARRVPFLAAALAAPGAWWVTKVVDLPGADWVPWLLFGWIVVSAPLVSSLDRHFADRGYGPILLLIAIAGMFTTLPDTEEILVVFGAALPLVLLAWPKPLASLGAAGVYPALGLLAWVIAVGGRGRESAIVGAVACLGLFILEPPIRWWRTRTLLDRIPAAWWGAPAMAVSQLVVVLLAARVAGLRATAFQAAVVALIVAGVTAAAIADRPVGRSAS